MTLIRPISDADIDAVAGVHVRAWRTAYAGIVPDDYLAGLDPAVFAERRRTQSLRLGQHTLVAERDGRVVGFASFGPYRDEDDFVPDMGELYAIYVEPDSWSTGAGRLLLEAAKAALRADGFPDMRLWVLEENHRARRFYERAGLAPDGTRQTYTPRGTTAELPELRYATDL
nr:GNAT family N-acetyltransferase [uncultured Actinoplanes sp.]